MPHVCPKCGRTFDSAFCPDCGSPAPNTPHETLASPKPADDSPVIPAHASSSSSDWTGKKPKKPFYKKPWFIVIVVILILAAIGSMGGKNDAEDSGPSGTNEAQNESLSDQSAEEEPAELVSISATYSGSTEAGVSIETGVEGIGVRGTYDDGSTAALSGWTVDNPGTLVAGTTSTFTISCQGMTCTLDIACTTVDPEQFKASCVSYSYEELARNPDSYIGQNVVFRGEVIQVLEDASGVTMRVNVTEGSYGIWDDTVMAYYSYDEGESRILEDDIITMYGTFGGLYTYESVLGASITVPLMYVEVVELG